MRMGTFLLGGIVGAVAVVYMNRNNGMSMFNLANAGQTVGNMVNKAKSNFSNMNSNMGTNNQRKNPTTDQSNENADLSTVEQIIKKDPELKNTVDEILADDKQSTSYRMQ